MLRGLAPLLLAAIAPGCVLAELDPAQSQEATTVEVEGIDEMGEAFCRWYYDCGCDPGLGPHRTVEECQLHATTEITRRLEQGSDAELRYDDACLEDIADYFEVAECADASEVALDAALRGALDTMLACKPWSGGAREGETCSRLATAKGDDCAQGLACDVDFDVCVPSELAPLGAPCGGFSPPCGPELSCVTGDDGDRCVRLPKVGEACGGEACEAGAWCDPSTSQCAELPVAGQACVDGGNAYEWGCRRGFLCDEEICVLAPGELQPCADGECAPGLTCEQSQCVATRPLVCDLEGELP
ncbi:MAG: hypothetical protein AAF721_10435 [Myxococcota bacterium]